MQLWETSSLDRQPISGRSRSSYLNSIQDLGMSFAHTLVNQSLTPSITKPYPTRKTKVAVHFSNPDHPISQRQHQSEPSSTAAQAATPNSFQWPIRSCRSRIFAYSRTSSVMIICSTPRPTVALEPSRPQPKQSIQQHSISEPETGRQWYRTTSSLGGHRERMRE